MTKGWECPVCGRGVAPDEKFRNHGGWLPHYPQPSTMPGYVYPKTTTDGVRPRVCSPISSSVDPFRGVH